MKISRQTKPLSPADRAKGKGEKGGKRGKEGKRGQRLHGEKGKRGQRLHLAFEVGLRLRGVRAQGTQEGLGLGGLCRQGVISGDHQADRGLGALERLGQLN